MAGRAEGDGLRGRQGYAPAEDREDVFAHLGILIGTPEYMSPEQALLAEPEIRVRLTSTPSRICSTNFSSAPCRAIPPRSGGPDTRRFNESFGKTNCPTKHATEWSWQERPRRSPNGARPIWRPGSRTQRGSGLDCAEGPRERTGHAVFIRVRARRGRPISPERSQCCSTLLVSYSVPKIS